MAATVQIGTIFESPVFKGLSMLDEAQRAIENDQAREGLDELFSGLTTIRNQMDRDEWAAFTQYARDAHELAAAIFQDPMTRRAYEKPRGYAGDAVMMDYLYRVHLATAAESATLTGRAIFRYIQDRPAGQAVRYRRVHIASLIDQLAATKRDAGVLAVASGHLREAELSRALAIGNLNQYVALDADAESLKEVRPRKARGTAGA